MRTTCEHCGADGRVRSVAPRIDRCEQCGHVVPQPRVAQEVEHRELLNYPSLAPGGLLRGKYRLIELLGEGAHGITYLAEHEYLSHPCVVKVLPQWAGEGSDTAVRRLRSEARAGFRVNDPHVVRVLDCDVEHGTWYFVMEYVEGIDLATMLRHGVRLGWEQAVELGIQAARGLAAIHRCGLVHRDIKPSNLLLDTEGSLRVADLGVAGLAHEHGEPGPVGTPDLVGTLAYTAPEGFRPNTAIGPRADLYALGATLYHLVTGCLPHGSTQLFRHLIDLQCRPVKWPTESTDDAPEWFRQTVLQLLAIEAEQRIASPAALIERLTPRAERTAPPASGIAAEMLQPRGVGVLPFENEAAMPDDEWLGYALGNHVSRALSQVPGVYVADQDAMVAQLNRLESVGGDDARQRLRVAARAVGAATVVTGRFTRAGGVLQVSAEVLRLGGEAEPVIVRVAGQLTDLSELERRLVDQLVGVLGLAPQGAMVRPAQGAPTLAAHEKLVLGRQAFLGGDYARAVGLAQEAVGLSPDFAEAIGFIGVCHARQGNYEAAEVQHRTQEALAERWGDGRLKIEALANLGVMNYFRGDYEAAQTHYERAAEMAGRLGLAIEEAQICNNLGFALYRRGRLPEAERAFARAVETHRTYGGLTSLIGPYNGLGNVLVEQKRYDEARSYYRRALALAEEIGDRTSVGTTHMHLGRCAALEERFAEAKHELTMAVNALEETRFWNGLARAYEYIAEMNLQLGDCDEAVRCADKRIELARQHSNARMEAAAWEQKAESLRRAGREGEAAACLAHGRGVQAG